MHSLPLIENDPGLMPFEQDLINRITWYQHSKSYITKHFGSISQFATAHHFFGFNYDYSQKGWWFREWLPNAKFVSLIGDFNQWDRSATPLKRGNYGAWEVFLPDKIYQNTLVDGSDIKMHVHTATDQLDRIPAYIKEVSQNDDHSYNGVFRTSSNYKWKNKFNRTSDTNPLIYEAHIGMATEEKKVGGYREFADNILSRIADLGYNSVQLMGIQEHPYYASFGYQVANFYAPSSRFGSADDLRYLIDKAHGLNLTVILDVVHSHSVKNRDEGLAELDGTDLYFEGWHPDWDSRIFDYKKIEVKRFLISNLRYWIDEFHFDGFRFDGVTSMMYNHFGHVNFDNYSKYFEDTNNDAIIYLQLANELVHELNPNFLSICEDMSGMPGGCRPIEDGGLGFDYRLAMGIPDYWINTIENKEDADWNLDELFWELTNRRKDERTIAYVESHDQALVGDKTVAYRLMGDAMYTKMSVQTQSLEVDRGIALHKLIRLVTIVLGGEGYMTFMGNEFGHPDWIDFPREGNDWSYEYARRLWSLANRTDLKYQFLENFDKAMIEFIKEYDVLNQTNLYKYKTGEKHGVLMFKKGDLFYLFNFSEFSYADFEITIDEDECYEILFSTDEKTYGGFDRIDKSIDYCTQKDLVKIYLPSRTCLVLNKI